MPAIRLATSAETLVPFCRRSDEPAENACFDTYADMVVFAASCGFDRLHGRKPQDTKEFLSNIYPIDLAVFKNQGLFPNLLLIGLATERNADIARDEDRLCRLVESFADVGLKYLSHELTACTPARLHLELACLLCKKAEDIHEDHI
ncbi:MAG: hypothetical protein C5B50_05375 [Verrucomicrobia bacterium]|nr:MAG: hypothetical protein C5B50_05375 [Verrucomicrobiota bacterium]